MLARLRSYFPRLLILTIFLVVAAAYPLTVAKVIASLVLFEVAVLSTLVIRDAMAVMLDGQVNHSIKVVAYDVRAVLIAALLFLLAVRFNCYMWWA